MAQSISQEAIGATGLPGATAASRHAGATASGAPTTGTFAVGDYIVDQTGKFWVCTAAGTPGTWGAVGGSSALTYAQSFIGANISVASATPFNVTSLSLAAGTWLINCVVAGGALSSDGDFLIDYWVGPTSASASSAYFGTQIQHTATLGRRSSASFSNYVVLASTTTVYFGGEWWYGAGTIYRYAVLDTSLPVTYMSAIKIA